MIAWLMVFGLSCTLMVTGLALVDMKRGCKRKDAQIKMLMERIWNLKKVIKDNGLV